MRRPLDWLVVALSIAFLFMGKALNERAESRLAGPDTVLEIPSEPAFQARVLPFEQARPQAVPATLRRERSLDFGYVSSDTPALP